VVDSCKLLHVIRYYWIETTIFLNLFVNDVEHNGDKMRISGWLITVNFCMYYGITGVKKQHS